VNGRGHQDHVVKLPISADVSLAGDMAETRLFRTILCPVDFSDHSRQALAYAALLSSRVKGRLAVIFVEDPMLAAASALRYDDRVLLDKGRVALRRFADKVVTRYGLDLESLTLDVAVGRPHEEIAWTAEQLDCDLIVMGAHGRTGANKMFFGSTTHRMLRKSPLPVLATPPVRGRAKNPPRSWPGTRALAPIDLSARDRLDAVAAAVSARELGTMLELIHVSEPIAGPPWLEVDAARRNLQRQRRALAHLELLQAQLDWAVDSCRVESGKPAAKIAAVASSREVGVVIMTRKRGQGLFGPRQGSISYQVLCEAGTPVLALPSGKAWTRKAVGLVPRHRAAPA
jgi:nucleotide-binding universal stress UspA family protein